MESVPLASALVPTAIELSARAQALTPTAIASLPLVLAK